MIPARGWYSVIQFCPDPSRDEAANVGVLLFCPDRGFVKAQTAPGNDRVKRFFHGEISTDLNRINADKVAIVNRVGIEAPRIHTIEDLNQFIHSQANSLRLTDPRSLRVRDPEDDLQILFAELVGGRSQAKKATNLIADRVSRTFDQLKSKRHSIQIDPIFKIPTLHGQFRANYAFANGKLNLVRLFKSRGSPSDEERLAFRLAGEGQFIERHSSETGRAASVIVVSALADESESDLSEEQNLERIFTESGVKFYPSSCVDEFIKKVDREAR